MSISYSCVDYTSYVLCIFPVMHNMFQRDICRLKLKSAQAFMSAISTSMIPVTASKSSSLKISAEVRLEIC